MSIAEIAERLHFADQSSFSKIFIRHKGIPSQKLQHENIINP